MIATAPHEIEGLQAIGRIVARTIAEMKRRTRAGMTTAELDAIGEAELTRHGASSAPKTTYDFPGYTCISLNREVAHGIPGDTVIRFGDLVNIDVSAEKDGYYADAGESFVVMPDRRGLMRLCRAANHATMAVIDRLRPGMPLREVGRLMEQEARSRGYRVVRNLCSHGIGRGLHEEPEEILPFDYPRERRTLQEGQVITIEPFVSTRADSVVQELDGWTLVTPDDSLVAQVEHTVIVTKKKPIITTLA